MATYPGTYSKHSEQGIIDGVGHLDKGLVDLWKNNSQNTVLMPTCYPGGGEHGFHDIYKDDTVISQCQTVNPNSDGSGDQMGVASVAGMNQDEFCSTREMEDNFKWMGIATTDQEERKILDANQSDSLPQGFGLVRAGIKSIQNRGPVQFYPGDLLVWRLPPALAFDPKAKERMPSNLYNKGRPEPYYERFNPLDVDVHLADVFACMTQAESNGGIKGMPYNRALPHFTGHLGELPWSARQTTAISFKYGLMGLVLMAIENMRNVSTINLQTDTIDEIVRKLGLFDTKETPILDEVFAALFHQRLAPNDRRRSSAVANLQQKVGSAGYSNIRQAAIASPGPSEPGKCMANLRIHAADILVGGIVEILHNKRSKIVGRAENAAGPGQTLDVLWGMTTTC